MRKIVSLAALALMMSTGVALADRGGPSVRDHRGDRGNVRDHRGDRGNVGPRGGTRGRIERHDGQQRGVERRPVYSQNGRYHFDGGVSYPVARPRIQQRHTDHRYRPQPLVESHQNVTGYTWVAGQWQWNGYEWTWTAGHYEPATYGNGQYQNGYGYDPTPSGSYAGHYSGDGDCY